MAQQVPGSMIAKLWFNSLFPPPLVKTEIMLNETTNETTTVYATADQAHGNIFSNLMVRLLIWPMWLKGARLQRPRPRRVCFCV